MSPDRRRIVLGSGSARRRELLQRLGLEVEVVSPDIDESVRPGEQPARYVRRLAEDKHRAVRAAVPADRLLITADTTVDVDGEILGKPDGSDHARAMLRTLSGRTHLVHTGVCVSIDGRTAVDVVTTEVTFAELADADVEWYVATGEPFDKAGGYGMQGAAGVLVLGVHGSVSNVIGLPLAELATLTRSIGAPLVG